MPTRAFNLAGGLLENVDTILLPPNAIATIENGYVNDGGGISRFPGLKKFADFGNLSPTYLYAWDGDLIAGQQQGQCYRVGEDATVLNVTGDPMTGGGRTIFAKGNQELLMASGGRMTRLRRSLTEFLDETAPESTHVQYVAGYTLAIEPRSGRFRVLRPGETVWNALDTFSAEGQPDDLWSLIVSQSQELYLSGADSVETFTSSPNGDLPFYRSAVPGNGIIAPYVITATKTGVWAINNESEFVNLAGAGQILSGAIASLLEAISDWTEAWLTEIIYGGQRFFVLQAPNARNPYGTVGLTLLLNEKRAQWSFLYGWDEAASLPGRWPGWSAAKQWRRSFVGGNGCIYEIDKGSQTNAGMIQPLRWRSSPIVSDGSFKLRVNDLSLKILRGGIPADVDRSTVSVRFWKDDAGPDRWIRRDLGDMGERYPVLSFPGCGEASTWQVEVEVTDAAPVEIRSISVDMDVVA